MNQKDLALLYSRVHTAQRSVLSVYLDVDQSQRSNLNRGFESQLKKLAASLKRTLLDVGDRDRFGAALRRAQDFVAAYTPAGKSLAIFCDVSDGFFRHHDLMFSVAPQIRWDRELIVQPLAAGMDQLEAYGVVLTDRAKSRLFVVAQGGIEEVGHEQVDGRRVRHIKTAGTDHADSSSRIQRKADNQIRTNLRQVVKNVEGLAKAKGIERFVLAGRLEVIAELRGLLPQRLAARVVGHVEIASNASTGEILAASQPVADRYERETEVEKVANIVTSAAKKGKAVVGLGETLSAVNSDRVWELVYSGGFLSAGFECSKCTALFAARVTRCPYCSARLQAVGDVVERAVEHALRKQARIEIVTGEAAAALKTAGSIGAFLKTRTGTMLA